MKITNNTVFVKITLDTIPNGAVVRSAKTGGIYITSYDDQADDNHYRLTDLDTGEILTVTQDYIVYPVNAELVVSG